MKENKEKNTDFISIQDYLSRSEIYLETPLVLQHKINVQDHSHFAVYRHEIQHYEDLLFHYPESLINAILYNLHFLKFLQEISCSNKEKGKGRLRLLKNLLIDHRNQIKKSEKLFESEEGADFVSADVFFEFSGILTILRNFKYYQKGADHKSPIDLSFEEFNFKEEVFKEADYTYKQAQEFIKALLLKLDEESIYRSMLGNHFLYQKVLKSGYCYNNTLDKVLNSGIYRPPFLTIPNFESLVRIHADPKNSEAPSNEDEIREKAIQKCQKGCERMERMFEYSSNHLNLGSSPNFLYGSAVLIPIGMIHGKNKLMKLYFKDEREAGKTSIRELKELQEILALELYVEYQKGNKGEQKKKMIDKINRLLSEVINEQMDFQTPIGIPPRISYDSGNFGLDITMPFHESPPLTSMVWLLFFIGYRLFMKPETLLELLIKEETEDAKIVCPVVEEFGGKMVESCQNAFGVDMQTSCEVSNLNQVYKKGKIKKLCGFWKILVRLTKFIEG